MLGLDLPSLLLSVNRPWYTSVDMEIWSRNMNFTYRTFYPLPYAQTWKSYTFCDHSDILRLTCYNNLINVTVGIYSRTIFSLLGLPQIFSFLRKSLVWDKKKTFSTLGYCLLLFSLLCHILWALIEIIESILLTNIITICWQKLNLKADTYYVSVLFNHFTHIVSLVLCNSFRRK
jgi:hypothetical protein